MIPRLGDGNCIGDWKGHDARHGRSLENDSPSRGRKLQLLVECIASLNHCLENDSPSRGRKLSARTEGNDGIISGLENDSPSRGRKLIAVWVRKII